MTNNLILLRSFALTLLLAIFLRELPDALISNLRQAWPLAALLSGQTTTIYYVSPHGDDKNSGLSPNDAWRTINRVNKQNFEPGSQILFEGEETFIGNLFLDETDCRDGTESAPTTIGSYGDGGPATIFAGNVYGIRIRNCDHIEIRDLVIDGSGEDNPDGGLEFVNTLAEDVMLNDILVYSMEVSGFRYGIRLRATNGLSGFTGVWIIDNYIHHNIDSGITTIWEAIDYNLDERPFQDLYIAYNKVSNTLGDPDETDGHTGSGIILGSVEDAIVEHNLALYNGVQNKSDLSGPVGIWAWDCKQTIIQHNEAYANRSNSLVDGGGIDLDGGCQDSIIQYNFTHNNDGAGYMIGQFIGARDMQNITVRYNLSVNDARRNDYGGIHLFTAPGKTLQGVDIYQNTIFISPGENSAAAFGVSNWSPGLREVRVINNSFIAEGDTDFVEITQVGNDIQFWGNNYDSMDGTFAVRFAGGYYNSLANWRTATGQEQFNNQDVGSTLPAGVWKAGGEVPDEYQLLPDSALVDRGLDLLGQFGIEPPESDYFGNPVPDHIDYDIGMHELPEELQPTPTPTPTPTLTPTQTPSPTIEPGAGTYKIYMPISVSSS